MANREQDWGWRGGEGRSFDDREGGEPWRGEGRYGSRYERERAGYAHRGYGGQEYGVEGGHRTTSEADRGWRGDERETWRPGDGAPYGDLELNERNRGIQEFGPPADYAYHPRAGHEFDPDYLRWREERMRGHDRDYHEWRKRRRDSYDAAYRRLREQGRRG
jgi:hypothetical protein